MTPFFKKSNSVVLIDIGPDSVAGAYMHVVAGAAPVISFSTRVTIAPHEGEETFAAVSRALEEVCSVLIRDGSSTHRLLCGSFCISHVFVGVAAPWQKSSVRTESIQDDKPFVFTHAVATNAIGSHTPDEEGRTSSEDTVIATFLNGYETNDPWGKKVNRAEIMILSSSIDSSVADTVRAQLRKTFHTSSIRMCAFAPAIYRVIHDLYPLQKDALVIGISGDATDAFLIKHGHLMDVVSATHGLRLLTETAKGIGVSSPRVPLLRSEIVDPGRNMRFSEQVKVAHDTWIDGMKNILRGLASRQPLPRTLFLLSAGGVRDFLRNLLDDATLRSVWLSDEPLTIIALSPAQFAPYVTTPEGVEPDIFIEILALYYAREILGG